MRGWISDERNYSTPVEIGSVMRSVAVGEVVESRQSDFKVGEVVTGWFGWQQFAAVEPGAVIRCVTENDLPRSLSVGVLGINGVTALIGLTEIGHPSRARHCSCRPRPVRSAPRSARSQDHRMPDGRKHRRTRKAALWVNRFGYDAMIDYRTPLLCGSTEAACPTHAS
jgi:hypothetical protein